MRLWLKDSERRPDPTPVETDDRKAVLVGSGLWVVALVVVLAVPLSRGDSGWWLTTCAIGILLGAAGLIYTTRRQRRR